MSTATAKKPLDEAALLSRFEGKMPLLKKLSGILSAQTPRFISDVRRGIDQGDGARVAHAAHTLKGSLAQIGAITASELAEELEQAGEAGVFSRSEALVNELEREAGEVQRVLDELTKSV